MEAIQAVLVQIDNCRKGTDAPHRANTRTTAAP
jgi:hypothetical protein